MVQDKYLVTDDYKTASIEILIDNLPLLRARRNYARRTGKYSWDLSADLLLPRNRKKKDVLDSISSHCFHL